jgi:PAS domain S-box-containing protein
LRRAEASLEESRAKMQLALDAGNVGVWRWDLATDEVAWDEKLDAMFGLTPDQSPRTVAQYMALIPEDQKPAMRAHIARALETGHYPDFELRADRSGGTRWFIIKGGVLRDTAGKVTALLGGVIDATERRHTEERLRQSQKLEAVGQLAAGVAHNFNNMLAVILASLEMLKTQPGYPNPALLEDALVSATNAAELVRQLMVFSRSQPDGGQRTEPLSEVVRRSVQLCAQTFDRSIALELGPLELAGSVKVDSGPMEQAVVNLLLNARDALPGTGRPGRIEVSVVALGSAMRALHPDAEGPWVELRVRDNGQGMSAATRARMLEPFFTTKGARSGTGLGLSTVWATVRAHQGFLECESEPGKGTTFSVILPAQASPVATLAPNHRAPGAVGAGAAVLIVDDQDAVRRAHEVLLRAAGFTVLTAASGAEAIAAAAGAPIDVVLLDYSMPGLSAEETLRGLRTTRPGLPVVCLSGLGATLEGATAQLTKPVSQEVLVGTLLRALEPK